MDNLTTKQTTPNRNRYHLNGVVEIGHELTSTAIIYVLLVQVGQLLVTGESMCTLSSKYMYSLLA